MFLTINQDKILIKYDIFMQQRVWNRIREKNDSEL